MAGDYGIISGGSAGRGATAGTPEHSDQDPQAHTTGLDLTTLAALEMSCLSDPGCVRSLNEDAVVVEPELGLMVVADGMGGHNAGEVAAKMAVAAIVKRLKGALSSAAVLAPELVEDALRGALLHANTRIAAAAAENSQMQGMGATVVCLVLQGSRACIAHLGDSRAYRLRDGKLRLLTRDHSLSQEVRDLGVIGEDAIAASHNRHLISQALGRAQDPHLAIQQVECVDGDLFLLCSDGLNDMVDGADIELALRVLRSNLTLAASQLVMIARDNGGYDNITVALARCGSQRHAAPPQAPATGPGRWLRWFRSLFGARS